jgi:hypothetical protein
MSVPMAQETAAAVIWGARSSGPSETNSIGASLWSLAGRRVVSFSARLAMSVDISQFLNNIQYSCVYSDRPPSRFAANILVFPHGEWWVNFHWFVEYLSGNHEQVGTVDSGRCADHFRHHPFIQTETFYLTRSSDVPTVLARKDGPT